MPAEATVRRSGRSRRLGYSSREDEIRGQERARILNDLDGWIRYNPNAKPRVVLAYLRGELR